MHHPPFDSKAVGWIYGPASCLDFRHCSMPCDVCMLVVDLKARQDKLLCCNPVNRNLDKHLAICIHLALALVLLVATMFRRTGSAFFTILLRWEREKNGRKRESTSKYLKCKRVFLFRAVRADRLLDFGKPKETQLQWHCPQQTYALAQRHWKR